MRKFVKRLTAVMLSLAMVAACALQTAAAEGQEPESITLIGQDDVKFTDSRGIPLDQSLGDEYYKAAEKYTVDFQNEGQHEYTITPEGSVTMQTTISFGVQKAPGKTFKYEWLDLGTSVTDAMLRAWFIVDDSDPQYVKYTISFFALFKTTDTSKLKLKFNTDESRKVTLTTDGNGFNIGNINDESANEEAKYTFDVLVYAKYTDRKPYVLVNGRELDEPSATITGPTADGTAGGEKYTVTINSITGDTNILVGLEKKQFTVTLKQGSNFENLDNDLTGFANAEGGQETKATVEYGGSYTFTASSKSGYPAMTIKDVSITDPSEGSVATVKKSGDVWTIGNITSDVTVTINGPSNKEQKTITFLKSQGVIFRTDSNGAPNLEEGGKITKSVGVAVASSYTFHVTLEDAYTASIDEMVVYANGVPLASEKDSGGKSLKCTINVTDNVTVSVTGVKKNTYKVTLENGPWYTFSTTDSTTVEHEADFRFTVNVDPQYRAAFEVGGGTTETTIAGYISITESEGTHDDVTYSKDTRTFTVPGVKGNITIKMRSVPESKYTVKVKAGEDSYGTYIRTAESGSTEYDIPYNGDYTFTVKPNAGYGISTVTYTMEGSSGVRSATLLEKESDGSSAKYSVSGITGNVTITVTTVKVKYTVTFVDPKTGAGTVIKEYTIGSPEDGYVSKVEGATITLLDEPTALNLLDVYVFKGWQGNGGLITKLELKNVDQQITLTASLELNIAKFFNVDFKRNELLKDNHEYSGYEGDDLLRLWLIATWNSKPQLGDYSSNVRVENCGFLYSDEAGKTKLGEIDGVILKQILEKRNNGLSDKTLTRIYRDTYLYIYNYNCQSKGVNTDVFGLDKAQFSLNIGGLTSETKRYVRAYVELVVDNTHYYILSDTLEAGNGLAPEQ